MTEIELFTMVGIREEVPKPAKKVSRMAGFPWISVILFGIIVLCCLFAEVLMTKDPTYLDLKNFNVAPNAEFLFGTDTLGRDIFSGIWYGGRISITIGFLATLISTFIAVVYGSVSGIAPVWLDTLMMRFTEIYLSVPGLLLVLPLHGEALAMEADMRELRRIQGQLPGAKIVLADCGLTEEARGLARYLADREKQAELVDAGEFTLYGEVLWKN